ncbi:hypothetical protein EW145_g6961, partial [Phellinidium pouzarii]
MTDWCCFLSGSRFSKLDLFLFAVGSWILLRLSQTARARAKTTKLHGPPASSWLFGVSKEVFKGDSGALFEKWADEYGPVYQIPGPFGSRRTVLTDAKAIAHFYSKETFTFVNSTFTKNAIANLIGKGVLWAEGESHRRMNCVSLDSIGLAGFGHDFGALEGRHSDVAEMFDSFSSLPAH